jgi:transposase
MTSIPGISVAVADVIIAETGADMSRFPTAGHLTSWAGTCPGSHESAGRIKSTKTRPGNPYLKAVGGLAPDCDHGKTWGWPSGDVVRSWCRVPASKRDAGAWSIVNCCLEHAPQTS